MSTKHNLNVLSTIRQTLKDRILKGSAIRTRPADPGRRQTLKALVLGTLGLGTLALATEAPTSPDPQAIKDYTRIFGQTPLTAESRRELDIIQAALRSQLDGAEYLQRQDNLAKGVQV